MNSNPLWYYNIVAHPRIRILVDGAEKTCQARTDHNISVFRCEPLPEHCCQGYLRSAWVPGAGDAWFRQAARSPR